VETASLEPTTQIVKKPTKKKISKKATGSKPKPSAKPVSEGESSPKQEKEIPKIEREAFETERTEVGHEEGVTTVSTPKIIETNDPVTKESEGSKSTKRRGRRKKKKNKPKEKAKDTQTS